MKVYRLRISNFRGFEALQLVPRGHVFLVGQPGAGRSDVVQALWRVLSADSTRLPLSDDLDFFKRDLSRRIEIEVVLGDLDTHWQQLFLDRLELWDPDPGDLVAEVIPGSGTDRGSLEFVVRLCYRAVWDQDQQQARHWVDFPKFSDPESEVFRYVPRDLRDLPVAFVGPSRSSLSLAARGDLRRLIEDDDGGDFSSSLDTLMIGIARLSEGLLESKSLSGALGRLIDPLRVPLNLGDRSAADVVRFAPEGGSLAGVVRGLSPTVKLRDELGFLPLPRHGSTLVGLLHLANAIAQCSHHGTIVVADDFGEGIDSDAALHMASVLRTRASQLFLSTRMGSIGASFHPNEVVRLTVSHEGTRRAYIGRWPSSKSERIAARHMHLQLLPAVSSRAIAIVEGPHDRAALSACALKLSGEEGTPLLAARRITLLDAAAAEGSGGIGGIPRLAHLARRLGFFVIAVIDWDRDAKAAQQRLDENLAAADVVVRWPAGYAIEWALLEAIEADVLANVLRDVSEAVGVKLDFDAGLDPGSSLLRRASKFLKSAGGLHGVFVDALPQGAIPPLVRRCLEEVRSAVGKSGLIQL